MDSGTVKMNIGWPMETPENLGKKKSDHMEYVKITQAKVAELMGDHADQIFEWLEKTHPDEYKALVTECFVDENYARTKDPEQLKNDLRAWYKKWKTSIKEWKDLHGNKNI